jgi:hypothetical protein
MTRTKKIFTTGILIVSLLIILVIVFSIEHYKFLKKDTWTFMSESHRFLLKLDTSYMKEKPYKYGPLVRQIDIYDNSDNRKIQEISIEKYLPQIFCDSTIIFAIEDMNFDGHKDFRILKYISLPDGSIREYWCWLYNSSTNTFDRDTLFNDFRNPVFDQKQKTIKTNYKRMEGETFYDIHRCDAVYKFRDGHLTLIYEEVSTQDKDGERDELLYTQEVIDGKLVKKMVK